MVIMLAATFLCADTAFSGVKASDLKPGAHDGCIIQGCNGEICANADNESTTGMCLGLATTSQFSCYGKIGVCKKQATGNCEWFNNDELIACLIKPVEPIVTPLNTY